MKFLFFLLLWVILALLDTDPDPDSEFGSGNESTALIESGSGSETMLVTSQNWLVGLCKELRDGLLRVENGYQEVLRSYEMSVYCP
jgi:hypothetical protein